MRLCKTSVFGVILLLLLAHVGFCRGPITVSSDTLPREHWSYDAMAHLAARGLVPGRTAAYFLGDYLLDDLQMAREIKQALESDSSLAEMKPEDRALLSRLGQEFRNQLLFLGVSDQQIDSLQTEDIDYLIPTGYAQPLLRLSDGDTSTLGIVEVDGLLPVGRHGLVSATVSSTSRVFRENPDAYPELSKLFVKGFGRSWEWEIGRDYFWWGPGYSGSMSLSDNPPAFDIARVSKDFSLGKHIGHVQVTEMIAPLDEGDKHSWFIGRRWQKTFSSHFNLGINETVKAGKRPKPVVLVMPALYLYQNIYLNDVDADWNDLVSTDIQYRTGSGNEFYGEVIIDDITAPSFWRGSGTRPRKAGFLLGAYLPDLLGNDKTTARAEIIITDRELYLATRPDFPEINYLHKGQFIGHEVGNDAEALFLRLTHQPNKRILLAGEYLGIKTRSTGDTKHAANLVASYSLNDRISTSLRWRKFQDLQDERLELAGAYAF